MRIKPVALIALRRLVGKRRVSQKNKEGLFWLVERCGKQSNAVTIPASPMMPRYATTDAIPAGAKMADERAFGLSKSKGPATGKTGPRGRLEPPPEAPCRRISIHLPDVVAYGAGAGALAAPSGSARRKSEARSQRGSRVFVRSSARLKIFAPQDEVETAPYGIAWSPHSSRTEQRTKWTCCGFSPRACAVEVRQQIPAITQP
jgi:hypothetical protein